MMIRTKMKVKTSIFYLIYTRYPINIKVNPPIVCPKISRDFLPKREAGIMLVNELKKLTTLIRYVPYLGEIVTLAEKSI